VAAPILRRAAAVSRPDSPEGTAQHLRAAGFRKESRLEAGTVWIAVTSALVIVPSASTSMHVNPAVVAESGAERTRTWCAVAPLDRSLRVSAVVGRQIRQHETDITRHLQPRISVDM
jgi:hypothetical protein